jgi:hypothetical protein
MARVRMPGRLHGASSAPDFAWPGWRLRIPGGPAGGQYHGYIGPDSSQAWEGGQGGWPGGWNEISDGPQERPSGHSLLPGAGSSYGPWDTNWGGTAFTGGQTHSDHAGREIYRSPSEMRPRANASGGVNTVFGDQEEATAGYAEAPGNYRGLGVMMAPTPYPPIVKVGPEMWPAPKGGPVYPVSPSWPPAKGGPVYYQPYGGMTIPSAGSGATNVVAQPPQFQNPGPVYMVPWTPTPVSPTPAPVVQASPADYLPSQGQVVDGLTPGTPSAPTPAAGTSFSDWLSESTIIPNVANQWILLGVAGAFLMMRGKR